LVEPIEPNGPYGAKGIGEPALNPTMSAITNAIYDATGIRIKELPVSPEKILAGLKKNGENRTSKTQNDELNKQHAIIKI